MNVSYEMYLLIFSICLHIYIHIYREINQSIMRDQDVEREVEREWESNTHTQGCMSKHNQICKQTLSTKYTCNSYLLNAHIKHLLYIQNGFQNVWL